MNGYWYKTEEGDNNISICHYMRLDHFIQLVETDKLYATKRMFFAGDANEGYYDKRFEFAFSIASSNAPPQTKSTNRMMKFREIVECPVSCWNKREEESYAMWKAYATELGVCIRTTVKRFVESIMIDDLSINSSDRLICGSMKYIKHPHSADELGQMFNKYYGYSDENEYRFYLDLKNGVDYFDDHILVPINSRYMIEEILISPFIDKVVADKFKRMIKCGYGIENVRQSEIKIKK